ncbi:MAG: CoA transferase, partial [Actinomycetota bacterium]
HYNALFGEGGRPDLVDDERFQYAAGRYENSDSLYRDVSEVLATRTTAEWLRFCERHRIPAAVADTLEHIVAELPLAEHPVVGAYRTIPAPERFSATPVDPPTPAPLIGQDGRALLGEVGYSAETLDRLEAEGVLGPLRR